MDNLLGAIPIQERQEFILLLGQALVQQVQDVEQEVQALEEISASSDDLKPTSFLLNNRPSHFLQDVLTSQISTLVVQERGQDSRLIVLDSTSNLADSMMSPTDTLLVHRILLHKQDPKVLLSIPTTWSKPWWIDGVKVDQVRQALHAYRSALESRVRRLQVVMELQQDILLSHDSSIVGSESHLKSLLAQLNAQKERRMSSATATRSLDTVPSLVKYLPKLEDREISEAIKRGITSKPGGIFEDWDSLITEDVEDSAVSIPTASSEAGAFGDHESSSLHPERHSYSILEEVMRQGIPTPVFRMPNPKVRPPPLSSIPRSRQIHTADPLPIDPSPPSPMRRGLKISPSRLSRIVFPTSSKLSSSLMPSSSTQDRPSIYASGSTT